MLIITQQPDTIRKLVISEVNRGITILKGAGGYTGKDKEILLVVVKIRQLGHLLKLIERVDLLPLSSSKTQTMSLDGASPSRCLPAASRR